MTSTMTLTQVYEDNIRSYASDPDPQIRAAGSMGMLLMFGLWNKKSRDILVATIYWKVQSLAYTAGSGGIIDVVRERERLEELISKAD